MHQKEKDGHKKNEKHEAYTWNPADGKTNVILVNETRKVKN